MVHLPVGSKDERAHYHATLSNEKELAADERGLTTRIVPVTWTLLLQGRRKRFAFNCTPTSIYLRLSAAMLLRGFMLRQVP
jgi:hypothetical protein